MAKDIFHQQVKNALIKAHAKNPDKKHIAKTAFKIALDQLV